MNSENGSNKGDFSDENLKTVAKTDQVTVKEMVVDTIRFALISLAIVLPIRMFVAQPFLVHGASMDPTFADGDYLIVDQISYRFQKPQRGDVIIFKYPKDKSKFFIKRIIGLPGEEVTVNNNEISIKSPIYGPVDFKEDYIKNRDIFPRNINTKLADDEYFVMGDNRPASSDSRDWGPLKRNLITGQVLVRLLPISHAEIKPGQKF